MDEFEIARFGAGAAQLFDYAEADAAAAVHGHACGFVDYQQGVVFKNNPEFARRRGSLKTVFQAACGGGGADRGDADDVAFGGALLGLGAFFVYAHFAGADDAVDVAFGYAF